jgi:beta-mannosidase
VDDARRSEVRFATECLAFANPAAGTSADRFTAQPLLSYDLESVVTHINSERHATGAFEFVRDYYLSQLFKEDPRRLWQIDRKQYAYLTEIASAEVMGLTFNEWRRIDSSCAGALVWFWRDLAPGNGWGILDVHGVPKASYYYLRRALQPMCVFFTDEGCNEPAIHVVNETAHNLVGRLAVSAHRKGDSVALSAERALSVNARSAVCVSMSSIFDWFVDFGYAFQFADASYDILSAEVKDASGAKLADAIFFPTGPARPADPELSLEAKLHRSADALTLSVVANRFAQAVRVEVPGFIPEDNYFHLLPGRQRHIRLRRGKSLQGSRGTITALNARRTFDIAEAMAQG